jgi:hypothetical protein
MGDVLIVLAGSACALHFGLTLAKLARAAVPAGPRASDAQGRSRVLRADRRREQRGRRAVDRRGANGGADAADYSPAERDWTTARLRPERLAA